MDEAVDYASWSQERLVERVTVLEQQLKLNGEALAKRNTRRRYNQPDGVRTPRAFQPDKYSTRFIALKIAYLGKNYCGYEYTSGNVTPLRTIEEVLWKALSKARLILPRDSGESKPGEINWDGCEYSKCGRTDKGVSAFGQVIGIRVRSKRPLPKRRAVAEVSQEGETLKHQGDAGVPGEDYGKSPDEPHTPKAIESMSPPLASDAETSYYLSDGDVDINDPDLAEALAFDPIADEFPYAHILNRLLPSDIRVLAWCPDPPMDFSARFSCRERRYRYFFTNPAFPPLPNKLERKTAATYQGEAIKEGWLDIEAMREAASHFQGTHDFRNFCKIDPARQIWNYERTMFRAEIEEVTDEIGNLAFLNNDEFRPLQADAEPGITPAPAPRVYTFTLHGSAFLWHQVRHMMAVLFLVGQRLEPPSIVASLLDITTTPCRPIYEMASDTPLVLWDCVFPREEDLLRRDALHWIHVGQSPEPGEARFGMSSLVDDLWRTWRARKMDELLASSLLGIVAGRPLADLGPAAPSDQLQRGNKIFDGGDRVRGHVRYVPLARRRTIEDVDVQNRRWAEKMGRVPPVVTRRKQALGEVGGQAVDEGAAESGDREGGGAARGSADAAGQ